LSKTKRVLIADDEAHVTHVVAAKLRKAGYQVQVAHDGDEALRAAFESAPDMLITDLQMPYLSGFEVAMRMKSDPTTANTPVLLLTARGYVIDSSEIALTNIRQIMAKPFSALALLETVQAMLGDQVTERKAA
jgi:two-component system alkaline phosphatase synthesis response regulator PhoP